MRQQVSTSFKDMSTFIRLSRRSTAISFPLRSGNAYLTCRNATTNATQVPTTPPQASKEDSGSVTGGKSQSSSVAPVPETSEVPVAAEIVSGAPGIHPLYDLNFIPHLICHSVELRHRLVRIYQPTRNTMQSGLKEEKWKIDWDVLPGAGRWQNPLIGWASSYVEVLTVLLYQISQIPRADYMQGTRVLFSTKEDAVRFAEKQGKLIFVRSIILSLSSFLFRLGLLYPTLNNQTRPTEKLQVCPLRTNSPTALSW